MNTSFLLLQNLDNNQASGVSLPSASADDYVNDVIYIDISKFCSLNKKLYISQPILEEQWAMKAFQHAETYFNVRDKKQS